MYFNLDNKDYRYAYNYLYQNPGEPLLIDSLTFRENSSCARANRYFQKQYKVAGKYYTEISDLFCRNRQIFNIYRKMAN